MPNLSSITHLELYSYSASISLDLLNLPLLEDLNLTFCRDLKIEGDLQSLTHLKFLKLVGCSKLFSQYSTKEQQKGKGLELRSLTHIEADYSLLNHEYHLILGSLPSLRILKFSGITHFTNNQNLWFEELTALQEIHFFNCKFEHLPASLTLLYSLKEMVLSNCTELQSLSDTMPPNIQKLTLREWWTRLRSEEWWSTTLKSLTVGMPPNPEELHLTSCSRNLVQLCKAYDGQDWQFISSILVIHIDDYTNRKDAVPTDAANMKSMEIQKPQISDAIVQRACNSCRKIFDQRSDFVLCDWK